MNKSVPQAVDHLLNKHNIKATTFCRETDIAYDYFIRIRRGGTFKEDYIRKVCKYFDVTANYLFFFDPLKSEESTSSDNKISILENEKLRQELNFLERNFYLFVENHEITYLNIEKSLRNLLSEGVFYQELVELIDLFKLSCNRVKSKNKTLLDVIEILKSKSRKRRDDTYNYEKNEIDFALDAINQNLIKLNFLELYTLSEILPEINKGVSKDLDTIKVAKKFFYEL